MEFSFNIFVMYLYFFYFGIFNHLLASTERDNGGVADLHLNKSRLVASNADFQAALINH